jgi:hypothetical protein
MKHTLYFLAGYAVLNIAVSIVQRLQTPLPPSGSPPTLADLRGFSAIWITFYYCAFLIHFSALRRAKFQ